MKTKRTQRYTGANWQGKGVSTGYKATQSQDKATSLLSAHIKPFAGKVFYLDLPSNRITETLENDIKDLGGTVEKFFSKEIKYLVSNKREARYVQCLGQNSPFPSTGSGQSSPHPHPNPHQPGSNGDNAKHRSQDQTDTFVTSRGKSLVKRVVKEQRVQINKILSNALEWGVKILYIDDIIAYLQKKKKVVSSQRPVTTADKTNVKAESVVRQGFQKIKGGRISTPFVKVEDSSRHYCPIYLTMPNMPQFNLKTVPPCSPFFIEDNDPHGNKQWGHSRGVKASTSEDRAHGRKKKREKKGGGYCECCMVKYENITMHVRSERHKAFSKSDKYLVLDKLISTMRCNFIHIRTQFKRPKCSVPSVLIPPGPCAKTGLRHKGDPNTPETIKEEHHRTIDEHKRSYLRRIGSVPASAALIHTDEDRRSNDICTERSKHKSLGRKWSCRQNSLTSCTHKASQNKMETAPPIGEFLGSSPSRVTQVNSVNQEITAYMNSSASYFFNMNGQNEVPSEILNITNQREESELKQDSSVFECVQDGNLLPDKIAGNNLSEKEETSLPAQSFSPVPKIQRRIKVYKRKRRKLDTYAEHVKPSDIVENSRLKLWELFQSSDGIDVEFPGFED